MTILRPNLITMALSLVFTINIFIAEISNYKPYSLYLKIISSTILLVFALFDYRINKTEFHNLFHKVNFKRLGAVILSFLFILIISLSFSFNIKFGLLKTAHFIIGNLPALLVFLYFLLTATPQRVKIFLKTILILGVFFGSISLIFSPYNPTTVYSFEISRWSHVIAGRFLSSVVLIVLLLHFMATDIGKIKLILATTLLLASLYFVGMRASLLGISITIIIILFYAIIKKKESARTSLLISLLLTLILVLGIEQYNTTSTERYKKLIVNEKGEFEDGAILARLISYKQSWEIIKEHPITGIGLGGFYNNNLLGDISGIKYPHNLLIEIQLELGILGSLFLGWLLAGIFIKAYKLSLPLLIFFLFSFWLAMFSKDIATQTQLWIGIALFGLKGKKD